ncbi:MAG TPA: SLBB domain-containing protein [Candidatus Kapabacteria bacterium]
MKIFRFVLSLAALFAVLIAFGVSARAQFTAPAGSKSALPEITTPKITGPPTSTEGMTFESAIDPAEYHLGPGDVFEMHYWTSGETFYPAISADNMLLLPNVGAFNIKGKTFAELQDAVNQKIAQSFKNLNPDQPPISLVLYQPRKIFVTVKGDVENPGVYALSAATRPDIAIDLANKVDIAPQSAFNSMQPSIATIQKNSEKGLQSVFGVRGTVPASERYITVTHNDGTTDRIDLVRYNGLHDEHAEPPLREGDIIHVPLRQMNAASIGVYGAVVSPGDFEYVSGDSLSTAIRYALGVTANADLHHIELTRTGVDGTPDAPKILDLTAIEAHQAPDLPLLPNDRIIIRALPSEHLAAVVDLRGEVAQPGVYPIADGKTTLSDVIKMAGGLTANAYPAAGTVLRHTYAESLEAGTPEDIQRSTRLEDLSVADTGNFSRQLSMRRPAVSVDMKRLFVDNDRSADIPLSDGDVITIPKQPTTVYVFGFVNNAGYVSYQKDAPLNYYIAQTGGYANGADKSETAIIKLSTKAWGDPSDAKIEPGDEIFVPKEPDHSEQYNLAVWAAIVAAAGAVIAGISLYVNITRKP